MMTALLWLLACQLAGEIASQALSLPTPGPVLGLLLLLAFLTARGRVPDMLGKVADTLLINLSLFFVPAAVGVMQSGPRLAREAAPLAVAIIGSTGLAIIVAALVFRAVARATDRNAAQPEAEA